MTRDRSGTGSGAGRPGPKKPNSGRPGARSGGATGSGRGGAGTRKVAGRNGTGSAPARGAGATGKGQGRAGAHSLPPRRAEQPQIDVHDPDGVRLQKVLAGAGVGSRRACELLITQGRVEVDGQVVTELGVRIDPVATTVHVDGVRVQLDASRVYFALNKPLGVVSTMDDELGRPCLSDLVANRAERLFHVGRLDIDTDGLLLLTNDGELSNRLQHPSYGVSKTYIASVPGPVGRDVGRTLRAGVTLEEGTVAVDSFKLIDSLPGKAIVEVILHEGQKHVVRRLLEAVGHPVQTLTRVEVGPVRLGDLKSGRMRPLNSKEIGQLYSAAGL